MLKKSMTMYLAKMAGYALRLVLPFFLVRILSKSDFGAYRQFFLIEVIVATIFQMGINQALYYFIPRDEGNAGSYFVNSLMLNVLIFGTAFTGIYFFSSQLSAALNMPLIQTHFWKLTIFTMMLMLMASADCYMTARQWVKQSAIFQILVQVNVSIIILAVAFVTRSLDAIFTGMAWVGVLNFLLMVAYIHFKKQGFSAEKYFFGIKEQVTHGLLLGAGGSLWVVQAKIHELFVSRYFGQELFAIYSAGCTQIPIVDFYLISVAVVSLGKFAYMEKEGDWQGIQDLWKEILTSLYGLAIPGVIFLLIVSKPLVLLMFTADYADAVTIFRINTLIKLAMLWNSQLVLRAMGRNDVVLYVSLGVLALTLPILFVGMWAWGMQGIIVGQLILMFISRLGLQFAHNRIASRGLPYFVPVKDVLNFYKVNGFKLVALLRKKQPQ
jgi:O-antigen/teichoic acid export membrane protein